MSTLLEYRLRIRDAADATDVLVVSSVRGDALPWLADVPAGDGAEFDPLTGSYRSGSMTFRVADGITSGTNRVVTAQLEDAQFRQQLGGRPAYGEERVNGGAWSALQAGIITEIRLASPAVWEIVVGDTTRATRNLSAFAPKRDAVDNTIVEPFATYLARWPQRGCLAGGPIIGDFLGVHDRGGWEMVVDQVITNSAGQKLKRLTFVSGYAPPGFGFTTSAGAVADSLNSAMGDRTGDPIPTQFPADLEPSSWPDVVVQVGSHYFSAASPVDAVKAGGLLILLGHVPKFMLTIGYLSGFYVWDTANVLPVSATRQRVRVFDAIPSERSPVYVTGHPLDLWTRLCDEPGLRYDASAVTAVTQAIGTDRRISLRITGPQSWSSFVESTLYGPCGFSVRTKTDGSLAPFSTRLLTSTAPTRTIASADVPQDTTVLFDLSEPDAITKVTVNQQNLVPTDESSGDADSGSGDGVQVQSVTVIRTSGDGGGAVDREQSYSIPGFLHTAGTQSYVPQLVDALAKEIFDRQSRGRLSGELTLLRGGAGDGTVLGDEIIVALPHMPNHNKRLGDDNSVAGRVLQVVRMTPSPRGMAIKLLDSGASNQTVPTVPTLSIAAGYGAAVAAVTITNAAALNAAGYGARLQWAVTSGGVPATGQYADTGAYQTGKIPTTAIALPAVVPGQTIYVRARSEQPRVRPSNYGTAVSLATTAFGAPSGLTATPSGSDGSRAALAWTTGTSASTCLVDVFVRLSADPSSNDVPRATLNAGSVAYTLEGLTPGASYTASVRHRDAAGNVSAKTTITFTATATTVTLSPPLSPYAIVGETDANGIPVVDGTYGLDVTAVVVPGAVEFWEAIETGVGAGTYGTAVLAATVAAVSGGRTKYRATTSNDGLRRSITARSARLGATSSSFTTAIIVNPWGAIVGPPVPTLTVTPTPGATTYSIAYAGTGTILLSIDGGAPSAPAASPILVTRDSSDHTYSFTSTLDGQATLPSSVLVPATAAVGFGSFTAISQAIFSTATDQVDFSWTWSGSSAYFQVYVDDGNGFFTHVLDTAVGASTYRFHSSHDITTNLSPTFVLKFYLQAVSGTQIVSTSAVSSATYGTV